jgi:hypothetical protein
MDDERGVTDDLGSATPAWGGVPEMLPPWSRVFIAIAVLAGVAWAVEVPSMLARPGMTAGFAVTWFLSAIDDVVLCLLPAAVFAWSRQFARPAGARAVEWGSVLWAAPAVLALASGSLVPEQYRMGGDAARLAGGIAILAFVVAPFLVTLGLGRVRETLTTWPPRLVAVALLVTGVLLWERSGYLGFAIGGGSPFDGFCTQFQDDGSCAMSLPIRFHDLSNFVAGLYALGIAVLAWSSLSGLRAREVPTVLYRSVAVGAGLILAVALYQGIASLTPDLMLALRSSDLVNWVLGIATVTGTVAIAFGFARAAWLDEGDVAEAEEAPTGSAAPAADGG